MQPSVLLQSVSSELFTFSLNKAITEELLSLAKACTIYRTLDRRANGNQTNFDIWSLTLQSPELHDKYAKIIGDLLNVEFAEIRLHRCTPEQKIQRHVDNYLPNNDTLIIRLDSNQDSRLVVNDIAVHEEQGKAYYLSEGTPHEVLSGKTERYSLTGWCHPRK